MKGALFQSKVPFSNQRCPFPINSHDSALRNLHRAPFKFQTYNNEGNIHIQTDHFSLIEASILKIYAMHTSYLSFDDPKIFLCFHNEKIHLFYISFGLVFSKCIFDSAQSVIPANKTQKLIIYKETVRAFSRLHRRCMRRHN
jgi:hypothetical protein